MYFRLQKKIGSTATGKVYYIVYRTEGKGSKQTEEKVGRESKSMTAARAAYIRADRARKKKPSNRERRKAVAAAKRAEEARPTIARLWRQYQETMPPDQASRKAGCNRYDLHLASSFAGKTPAELVALGIDRLRVTKLRDYSPQTVKHILALLRRIINFGGRKGLCPPLAPSRLHFTFPKVSNQRTENLTREQMAAYLAALDEEPDQHAAAFIRLALSTGMRKGALLNL